MHAVQFCIVVIKFAHNLIEIRVQQYTMDSEVLQTMEDSPTNADDTINESEGDQMEAVAAETADGGGHEDEGDSNAAAEIEKDVGDSTTTATAAAVTDDTKGPEDEEGEGGSSPQAERDSEESKKDEDTSESDAHQKAQSESEALEKIPLDEAAESDDEKEKELQHQVRFDVSGGSSTEGAGEETKDDPTAVAATDHTEQGLGTPTKLPLPSTESERGKEPVWYSHTSLLITSVFSIFCFFPMGIVALYYAMKVKDTYLSKNEATKIKDYARRSTFCSVAAIITGIVALLLILMVIILGITGVVGTG